MVTSVTKSSIISDIWRNFFDRIKAQVTTVTLSDGKVITIPTTSYVSSFPDNLIDSKSDYPIIVVNDPKAPTETFTAGKTRIDGNITVGIYTAQSQSASKFLGLIMDAIETYKGSLSTVGIKNVEVEDTSQDSNTRAEIKLHYREVVFSFTYFYSKTVGC